MVVGLQPATVAAAVVAGIALVVRAQAPASAGLAGGRAKWVLLGLAAGSRAGPIRRRWGRGAIRVRRGRRGRRGVPPAQRR